jgi:iron(III) transport system permease protein
MAVTAAPSATSPRFRPLGSAAPTAIATLLVLGPLCLFVLYPLTHILGRSFVTADGLGLGNYVLMLATPRFLRLLYNSFAVTLVSAALAVALAYGYAYAIQRTTMRGKAFFRMVGLLPLFAPSLVQAQGLTLLLGRNGLINRSFDLGIDIYGYWGIVISMVLYVFPYAFLILSAALAVADARLYESAEMLGANSGRIFRTVTLPSTKYGLAAAIFVCFTLVITDFGNPMVIGADYNVLATEVYNQVIGQANFERGTVIGMVLLIPAAVAAIVEKRVSRAQHAVIADQARPLTPRRHFSRDLAFLGLCTLVAVALVSIVLVVVYASFVHLWPYRMTFSLRHYAFDVQGGIEPLWNSINIALITAALGVVAVGGASYVIEKMTSLASRPLYFLAILPAAVPGMVLGLGYILAFNSPTNPIYLIYGTLFIIAIANVYHYHAQAFLIVSTSMKQISGTFDEASATLGGTRFDTLRKVILPLVLPTLLGVAVFFFMRAMVTLSAVIFLFTPQTQVAAVSVLLLEDRGATNQAAAFSVCIMASVAAGLLLVRSVLFLSGVRGVTLIR